MEGRGERKGRERGSEGIWRGRWEEGDGERGD